MKVQSNLPDPDNNGETSLIQGPGDELASNKIPTTFPFRNYTSYQEYKDATHRHVRVRRGPKQKWEEPLTSSQEWGWTVDSFDFSSQKIHGRKSCPETIYASELVKSGINY